jgi:hypothetical protein
LSPLNLVAALTEAQHAGRVGPAKGLTKAGVRKMIARLHEELAVYEGGGSEATGDFVVIFFNVARLERLLLPRRTRITFRTRFIG